MLEVVVVVVVYGGASGANGARPYGQFLRCTSTSVPSDRVESRLIDVEFDMRMAPWQLL
jgi:hypothetical protein